jgi:hypothetical protein
MALKDWKKTHEDKTLLIFEKDGKKVGVSYHDKLKRWVSGAEDNARLFQTKSQALKFAKSYMRKH